MNMSFSDICWLSLSLGICFITIKFAIDIHQTMKESRADS